jgi:hypothetical protein
VLPFFQTGVYLNIFNAPLAFKHYEIKQVMLINLFFYIKIPHSSGSVRLNAINVPSAFKSIGELI